MIKGIARILLILAAGIVPVLPGASAQATPMEDMTISKGKLNIGFTSVTLDKEINILRRAGTLIQTKTGLPVEIIYRKSYQEMSLLLETGGVDIAFVCGLPYILDHEKFKAELLVAPLFRGQPLYQSYLIVSANSDITALPGLRGKIFAFSDPLSNSGFLVPSYNLKMIGETPERFFRSFFFTYSHADSIEAVASGLADGANVDGYVWDAVSRLHPELARKTKVVTRSPLMPITPVVVRPGLPKALKNRLREIFIGFGEDQEGRKILDELYLDGFVLVDDAHYNSIREMYQTLKNRE